MRKALLLASVTVALLTLPGGRLVTGAFAQESTGLEWADKRIKWQSDVAQLTIRIRDYQLSPRYCRRPNIKDKTYDEVGLSQLEEELAVLTAEFSRIESGTLAATQGTTGGGLTSDRLMTRSYPKYRDKDVTDHQHWVLLRRDFLNEAAAQLSKKRKALAAAPEDFCGTPTPPKKEIIGTNPPVVPAVAPPTYGAVDLPAVPRFCSLDEKDAWLAQVAAIRFGALDNQKAAQEWAQALHRAVSTGRGDQAKFRADLVQAAADDKRFDQAYLAAEKLYVNVRDNVQVEKCGGSDNRVGALQSDGTGVAVNPTLFAGRLKTPRFRFVGKEHPVLLEQTFDIEDLKDDGNVGGVAVDFTAKLGLSASVGAGTKGFADSFHLGLVAYDADISGAAPQIDPMGERLLLPGTGETGAPFQYGLSLSAGVPLDAPGGFNVVDKLHYSYETDSQTFYGKYARTWFCDDGALTGYGGVGYSSVYQGQRLTGRILGYGTDFAYTSKVDVDVFRTLAGIAVDYPVKWFKGISIGANATGFVNFADAKGIDAFDLSGFTSQSIDIDKNETTFGVNAGISIDWEWAKGAKIGAGLSYTYDETTPVIIRDGNTPSRLEFESSGMFVGTVRSRFSF